MKNLIIWQAILSKLMEELDVEEANVLDYYGQRWPSVHHARMQIG